MKLCVQQHERDEPNAQIETFFGKVNVKGSNLNIGWKVKL